MENKICGYTQEDKQLAEEIITYIRREAARKYTYLEKGIFYHKPQASENVRYLGADYTSLYYNPSGVIELYENNYSKLEKAIIHTVLHCMLLHPSYDMKDNKLFDDAADAVVNAMIENAEMNFKCDFRNFLQENNVTTAVQLYNAAGDNKQIQKRLTSLADRHRTDDHCVWYSNNEEQEENEQSQNGAGGKKNKNECRSDDGSLFDVKMSNAESDWKMMLNAAESSCSMQYGTGTGNIFMSTEPPDRFSKFSYDEYIRRFVAEEIMEDDPETIDMMLYTMSMDLYDDIPIVEWNEIRERCNPSDLIIAMDMSGSCGGETASNFLRQIYTLFDSMNIRSTVNIHIVFFDTHILAKHVIHNKNEADEFIKNYSAMGFGGTDFNCVFEYADKFSSVSGGRKLKGLFFFSDACGAFPNDKKSYPTTFFVPEEEYVPFNVPEWIELVHYND